MVKIFSTENFLGATASRSIKIVSVCVPYQSPIKKWNDDLKHHLLASLLYNICFGNCEEFALVSFHSRVLRRKTSPF